MKKLAALLLTIALLCGAAALAEGPKTVSPNPANIDAANLADGEYSIAFEPANIKEADGGLVIENADVFALEHFDADAVKALTVGDTIVIDGEPNVIESIGERDGFLVFNDWIQLSLEEDNGTFRFWGDNDIASFTKVGTVTLKLSKDLVFEDTSDLEIEEPVTCGPDKLIETVKQFEDAGFNCHNTTATVQNGEVVKLVHEYMP